MWLFNGARKDSHSLESSSFSMETPWARIQVTADSGHQPNTNDMEPLWCCDVKAHGTQDEGACQSFGPAIGSQGEKSREVACVLEESRATDCSPGTRDQALLKTSVLPTCPSSLRP